MNAAHLHARATELVLCHGWNATAFQTLERGYRYALYDDACVAFVDTGSARVAAGAPIGPESSLRSAATSFLRAARADKKRCCFFATEARFLGSAGEALGAVQIGEQPIWDPRTWAAALAGHRSLREQLRRARAKNVRVRQLERGVAEPAELRSGLTRVARRWLTTRRMAVMGFLVQLDAWSRSEHRRRFVAERDGAPIAFADVIPVPARGGFLVEYLVRDPDAPNGTAELLVDAVMRVAAEAGSGFVTLGLAPLSGAVPRWLRVARKLGGRFYDFEGLRAFKAKLRPTAWSPIYLSYPREQGAFWSILDALRAFAGGSLLQFAWRTLTRRLGRADAHT